MQEFPSNETSDAELVITLQAHQNDGSPEQDAAMAELIERCKPEVNAVLRRTNIGWADMEDLEQEVFMLILLHIDQLRDPESLRKWVKMISRNRALSHRMRGDKINAKLLSDFEKDDRLPMDIEDELTDTPLAKLLGEERQQLVFQLLEDMKETDKLRLRQFYLQDMSVRQISEDAGGESVLPLGTIRRQLHTARNRFEEALWPSLAILK